MKHFTLVHYLAGFIETYIVKCVFDRAKNTIKLFSCLLNSPNYIEVFIITYVINSVYFISAHFLRFGFRIIVRSQVLSHLFLKFVLINVIQMLSFAKQNRNRNDVRTHFFVGSVYPTNRLCCGFHFNRVCISI